MTGWGTRQTAALAIAVLAAGLLAACGGSDSGTTAPADSNGASSSPQGAQGAGKDGGQGPSTGNSGNGSGEARQGAGAGGSNPSVDPAPLKVSGGGSAQYRVAGGDNSVQEFGEEADESELEAAAAALHAYLVARAEEDWNGACSHMGETIRGQLRVLATRLDQLAGKGCAEVLAATSPALPTSMRNESTIVDAGSLRFDDEQAFLIYEGAQETVYAIQMEKEDSAWKVAALAGIPLS